MKSKVDVLPSEELWGVARQIFLSRNEMEPPLKTEASGLKNVCDMKGSKPHERLSGLQHEMDEQVPVLQVIHHSPQPPHDEKQWNLGKNRLAKPFKELPEDREDHPLQAENLWQGWWQLRDVSGQHI